MERIAPLAKILAEANGIDWEHLAGTGPGGQIVEQDILDYLTKVMSGEAEPPSTPVDAPPPDWDGQDNLPDLSGFDTSALSQAGVESELTDYMQQSRPAQSAPSAPSAPTLAADDFELDDEPEPVKPVAAAPAPTAPAAGGASAGLGNLLSRLYHKDEPPAADQFAPVAPTPVAPTPVAPTPVAPTPVAPTPVAPTPVAPTPVAPTPVAPTPVAPTPVAPTPVAPTPVAPTPVAPTPVAPTPVAPTPVAPTPVAPTPVAPTPVAPTPVAPTPVAAASVNQPREAVWLGTYLRRDVNLTLLSDLRGQLVEALDREVPVALLVARAAQRHSALLGLQSVAVKGETVYASQQGSLRDALENRVPQSATPDLLVIDAGALDLDDLHYPETLSLSIGRLLDGRASLSLQGEIDTDKAAHFLAAVAETLEKPVILLV